MIRLPYLEKTRGLFYGEGAWIVHVLGDGSLTTNQLKFDEKEMRLYCYFKSRETSEELPLGDASCQHEWIGGSGVCNRKAARLEEEERPMSGLPSNSTPKSEDH